MGLAEAQRLICASAALTDGGRGARFTLERHGATAAAFVVRYDGRVHAYLNRCAHIPLELDWLEGEFFDKFGLYLICSTHGATYEPATGYCIMGPCKGQHLTALKVAERDGNVYLMENGNHDG
jgi:nitrite reductase/ring-hydroxylating ferredoxin subunit